MRLMYDEEERVDVTSVEIPEFTPEFLKETGMYDEESDPIEPVLNRKERRARDKKMKRIEKQIKKNKDVGKAVDLSEEDKLRVYHTLLERVRAKNAEFEQMKQEEEQTNE